MDKLVAIKNEINNLQERLHMLKDEAQLVADTLLSECKTQDEVIEIASAIYWEHDIVKQEVLRKHIKQTSTTLVKSLYQYQVDIACIDCGDPVVVLLKSRSHLEDLRKKRGSYADSHEKICPSCQEKRARKSEMAWAAWGKSNEDQKRVRNMLHTMPYQEYLKTDHWRETRRKALKRAGFKCQLCNADNKTLDVHHKTYERRGYEENSDLIVLCRPCHSKFHDKVK